jgi:hypothetical protein
VAFIKSVDTDLLKKIQPFFNGSLNRDTLEIKSEIKNLFEAGEIISKKIKEVSN